jgi:hypothetical protein
LLGAGALVALAVALAWDWSTSDYWETRPFLGSLVVIGLLSGGAAYVWRRGVVLAVVCGIGSVVMSAMALAFVALRWAS